MFERLAFYRFGILLILVLCAGSHAPADEPTAQPARRHNVVVNSARQGGQGESSSSESAGKPAEQQQTDEFVTPLEKARMQLRKGQYDQAVESFKAIVSDPEYRLAASLGLSEAYRVTGRLDEAEKVLDAAADVVAKAEPSEQGDYHAQRAIVLWDRGLYADALQPLRAGLKADPDHIRCRLWLARTLERTGQIEQAIDAYGWFEQKWQTQRFSVPDEPQALTDFGLGLARCYSLKCKQTGERMNGILNRFFQRSYELLDRTYWPACVAAGDMFLEKYRTREAAGHYARALRINSNCIEARLGLGRMALSRWQFERADEQVQRILKVNPKCVDALVLRGMSRMKEMRYAEAAKVFAQALEINPNSLEALAGMAAAKIRLYDRPACEHYIGLFEKINPRYATGYYTIGQWLSAARQYHQAERFFRRAIELRPELSDAWASLGMMLMQDAREEQARQVLEAAFKRDPYHYRVYNTLQLLDSLQKFEQIQTEHFVIRFDAASDAVLGLYLPRYMESLYEQVTRDFQFPLPRKTYVEIFPRHAQFGVRITGLPPIGTVGACTGPVVAMDAPRLEAAGRSFDAARVLRHEFTHVVTLHATDFRIPHWYTEALSVYNEHRPRPWKWVQMLAKVVREGTLYKVSELSWGFIRPRRRDVNGRTLAYAQSAWIAEYITDRYGFDMHIKMLRAFRDRQSQSQVFRRLLGLSEQQFDADFAAWAKRQVQSWGFPTEKLPSLTEARQAVEQHGDDAEKLGILAWRLAAARRPNRRQAMQTAEKALKIDGQQLYALCAKAKLLFDARRYAQAEPVLLELERKYPDTFPASHLAPTLLGRIYISVHHDYNRAAEQFRQLQRVSPFDPTSYKALAAIYAKRGDYKRALVQAVELADAEQNDYRRPALVAELAEKCGFIDQAIKYWMRAMWLNPYKLTIHRELARLYRQQKHWDEALRELQAICLLQPDEPANHAQLALLADKLGRKQIALAAAKRAVELDPDSPAKTILQNSP